MPTTQTNWTPAELEEIERDAWLDLFEAAPGDFVKAVGMSSLRIGSGAILAIRAVPLVQFNHAHGFGLDGPLREAELEKAVDELRTRASPVWAMQLPDTPDFTQARDWLATRKLAPSGAWAKFWRRPDPPAPATTALDLREVGHAHAMDFGRVVQGGFGAPPPFAGWAAALVRRPGWRTYVAYDGNEPVAGGALFLKGGLAWLGLGSTLPTHRGRGAQGAILGRRIADAVEAGARCIVTETGRPEPGEEGKHPSYRNILRAGFEIAYARLNFRPQ